MLHRILYIIIEGVIRGGSKNFELFLIAMTKIGAFCSLPVHLKKSSSTLVNGALFRRKKVFYFCEKRAKTGKIP
jgi:hypothetical protein